MTLHYYACEKLGCVEVYLDAYANGPADLIVHGVYEEDAWGPDLIASPDCTVRLIAAAVADAAKRDRAFIASVWQRQEEDREDKRPVRRVSRLPDMTGAPATAATGA